MRVNVYSEEMTKDVDIVSKEINGVEFTGLRIYLKSPDELHHRDEDDDRSAVTFWGKQDLRDVLWQAIELLNNHYRRREDARSHNLTDVHGNITGTSRRM